MADLPQFLSVSEEVRAAQRKGQAIVALESAVITHGLPRPSNLESALKLEETVRQEGAVPATIGLMDGRYLIGMTGGELETLATTDKVIKISSRDLANGVSTKMTGGTTVAATLRLAALAGIQVFATGGIGGVHRGEGSRQWDVSADLHELARQPVLVVCAGAKSILDLSATLEQLETLAVPVVGYQSDEFPAFYSRESGLTLNARVENPEAAAALARNHWQLGGRGMLLAAPIPAESAIPREEVEGWIDAARKESEKAGISGPETTPYLLERIGEISKGKSLATNLALLENNARVAAQVAAHLRPRSSQAAGLLRRQA